MGTVFDLLASLSESGYADFQAKLIPTVPRANILGVRLPALHALAKEIKGDEAAAFLAALPHKTLEENLLHAILVGRERDLAAATAEVEAFLPYADNWAVTDILRPAIFIKYPREALPKIREWLASPLPFVRRAAVGFLLAYYLDKNFDPAILALPAKIPQEEYYVSMMVAWFYATALAKRWDETLPYLTERRLPTPTHNRAIRKATESYRVSPEQKAFLKTLKIK
ncbi:MAG: DNA alkylation repair protein [Clostridia bacterium]|nr:DNA alkylation repair protein [Clostridia bacterium]